MQALDDNEVTLWRAFKHATEGVRRRVGEEITRATGLSDPDYGIVTRLDDAAGSLRQQALATSMGWHRSRLSHQLTRMESRGLVRRAEAETGGGVEIHLTEAGRTAAAHARPVHAAAVRRHLLDWVPPEHREVLLSLLDDLTR
ncbi:MAG: MarR family transcriptional regulator [Actinobacteria bacterium]|nr:MarR family transcriptional regulator [Actinomycetota bacterium]